MRVILPTLDNYVVWFALGAIAGVIAGLLGSMLEMLTPPANWYPLWVDLPGGAIAGVIFWEWLVVSLPATGLAGWLAGRLSRPVGRRFYLAACLTMALGMLLSIYFLVSIFLDFSMTRYRWLWWEYLPEMMLFVGIWFGRGMPRPTPVADQAA